MQAQCALVVDAGFSFTHALPFFDGQLLGGGVRRINLGGKALTNYFKELVSYRCAQQHPVVFLGNFSLSEMLRHHKESQLTRAGQN